MRLLVNKRLYSTHNSRHKLWYTDTLPALVPVFLLGSAVYLARFFPLFAPFPSDPKQGLQLTHLQLSHERHMEESSERIKQLEAEIETMQAERAKTVPPWKEQQTPKKRWWWTI